MGSGSDKPECLGKKGGRFATSGLGRQKVDEGLFVFDVGKGLKMSCVLQTVCNAKLDVC